jgi:putative holliday junction resolvase
LPDFLSEPLTGRILAMDVGKKRIGLAITDELGITAQGLPTFQRVRVRDDLEKLTKLAHDHRVGLVVIGKPLHMSGDDSRQSVYTEEFGERLRQQTALPVVYWDERLTTVEAERVLREGGATLEERKKAVDKLSAILLLESFLDARRFASEGTIG